MYFLFIYLLPFISQKESNTGKEKQKTKQKPSLLLFYLFQDDKDALIYQKIDGIFKL